MAYWGEIDFIENWQSIAENYTNVTINYYACSDTGSSYSGYTSYPYLGVYSSTVNYEESQALGGFNFSTNKRIPIGSITINIPHDSNGDMTVSASFTWNSGNSYVGTLTGSGSRTLTRINRASTPSIRGSSYLGEVMYIDTNRTSTNFTHNLYYKLGSEYWNLIAEDVHDTFPWTIPKDLANQIPYATSGYGTILCKTYNGSTLIGTKTITFTAYVPDTAEFYPSVTGISLYEAVSGITEQFGAFIQNRSIIHCVVAGAGAYSSLINTCKVTINGATYGTHDFTTDYLKLAGINSVVVTLTDSRGRPVTVTENFNVLAYTGPTITKFTANRCLEDGTLNDEGEYTKIDIIAKVKSLNSKNTYAYSLKYKDTDESEYTDYSITLTETTDNTDIVLSGSTIIAADPDNSFDYALYVHDYFTTTPKTTSIESVFQLINFNASGKGMAIGKVSEKDAFEVNMDMYLKGENIEGKLTSNFEIIILNSVESTTDGYRQILDYTIPEDGTYLLTGFVHSNHYGQSGRELTFLMRRNDLDFFANIGVCNTYIWTLSMSISAIYQFKKGDKLNGFITNTDGTKTWSCMGGNLFLVKLNSDTY